MAPTSVQPPDPGHQTPDLDIALASNEQLESLLPRQLGRYRLEEMIGEGGMARVFRAVLQGPAGFEKTVAIKLLKSTVQHRSAGDDFRREAVYASRIHHPNVVDVYELSEEEGCPFISMEWVDGEPLQKLLNPKSMPPPSVVLDLLIALLNGLEQAHIGSPESHRSGMLHRDIKPSNIIVSRHGVPKLVDFGIAAQMDANFGELLSSNGMVVGTINWMSPEQIQGQPLDERSDLFSFGLVMATMVLCRSPLRRRYMHELIQEGKPIPQCLISLEDETTLDSHIPGFGTLVAGVLSRDPTQRPRTARDLRKRLEDLRPSVGHRPTLPQWMNELRADISSEPPPKQNNETTWVMGRTGRFHEAPTTPVAAGNVPTDNSLFIGRTAESADVERHLSHGERLVTLVGTGGAGKTRLSRRIANRFSEQLAGGAWFVDLSDVHSEDGIVQAVAKAMGLQLPDDGAHPSVDQLAEIIATRDRVLIVLDNFEQLVSHGPATVGRWLNKAPLAQFLVTTREGLMLPEEVQVPLNPLSQDEAIELLHQRARLAGAEWPANGQDHRILVQIVDALDRLPLAIELAAARARFLTPEGLHERLEERFKLLQSGVRGGSDRQANLHNLIDWSWQRLEPWEQSTLAQLSCFRGGFSMEAAEAVVDLSAWPNAPWALDAVGALLDKSLIHTQSIDNQPRLFMYLSIRDFAAERLLEETAPTTGSAVAAAVSARHAEYFAGFSPVEPTGNLRLVVPTVRKQLDSNFDNLLAAARTGAQPQRTLCAVGALEVLMGRGPMSQAIELIDEVLNDVGVPTMLGLRLRILKVRCLRNTGRIEAAQQAMVEAARRADAESVSPSNDTLLDLNEVAAGLPEDASQTLNFEVDRRLEDARLLRLEGRWVDASNTLESALTLCSPTRTPTLQAKVQHALGWLLWTMGRAAESITHLKESRAAFRVAGQLKEEALALSALAYVLSRTGKRHSAKHMYIEAIELLNASASPTDARQVLGKLGNLEREMGEFEASLEHFGQALVLQAQVGDVMNEWGNRIDRDRTLVRMGRYEEAENSLLEVVAGCRQRKALMHEAIATETLGDLYTEQGRTDEALEALRFAYNSFRGKIPMVEATVGMSLAVALARKGELEELDALTQSQEQYVESFPGPLLVHLRMLAEVRMAQNEPAAAYRHIGRAREAAQKIEGGGNPKIMADLDALERKIIGK